MSHPTLCLTFGCPLRERCARKRVPLKLLAENVDHYPGGHDCPGLLEKGNEK